MGYTKYLGVQRRMVLVVIFFFDFFFNYFFLLKFVVAMFDLVHDV